MPKQELDGVAQFDLALSVLGLVLGEGDKTVTELSEIFEVSEKAIRKAVAAIAQSEDLTRCETHFYLNDDALADGFVSFSSGNSTLAGPPKLSNRQSSAIAIGLEYLAAMPEFVGNPDLASLRASFNGGEAPSVRMPENRLVRQIQQIQEALQAQQALHCEYQNQLGERSSRKVDPLRLDFLGRHHYLRGFCHLSGEVRSFRLDRILNLEMTAEPISDLGRSSEVPEDVFGVADQEHIVSLEVEMEASEIFWNFPAVGEPKLVGNKLVGDIRIGQLESLPRHVVRYGGMVRVLAPDSAKNLVREFAEKTLLPRED